LDAVPRENYSLEELYLRDRGLCGICGGFVPWSEATRDHIIPVVGCGSDTKQNLQLAHSLCNSMKGRRFPFTLHLNPPEV